MIKSHRTSLMVVSGCSCEWCHPVSLCTWLFASHFLQCHLCPIHFIFTSIKHLSSVTIRLRRHMCLINTSDRLLRMIVVSGFSVWSDSDRKCECEREDMEYYDIIIILWSVLTDFNCYWPLILLTFHKHTRVCSKPFKYSESSIFIQL